MAKTCLSHDECSVSKCLPSKYAVQTSGYEHGRVRVQAVVEQLAQRAASARPPGLLAVDAICKSQLVEFSNDSWCKNKEQNVKDTLNWAGRLFDAFVLM